MDKLENFKFQLGVLVFCEFIIIGLLWLLGSSVEVLVVLIGAVLYNSFLVIWTLLRYDQEKKKRDIDLAHILGNDAKDALLFGEVGIIVYDETYSVTWFNDFLADRGFDFMNKKLTQWNGQLNSLFVGDVDEITIQDGEYTYEVSRKEDSQVLYVKDITELAKLQKTYKNERIVLGIIQLDNYQEASQYEDEATTAQMNVALRQPIMDWAKNLGIVIRRVRNDRFFMVLDEEIYANIAKDKFSISNTIRTNAQEIGVSVTLSMAFARCGKSIAEMDNTIVELLELTQNRGGDQIAVKVGDEEVVYYGGNSEAQERRSRVRVRVMAKAIKEAVEEAERVFIVGHKTMDFDCMGANLGMSRLCAAHGRLAYIVSESGGIEEQCKEAMHVLATSFEGRHRFINDETASKMITDKDLVIAVDFHNPAHCNAPMTLESASKVIVIDHHRRSEAFIDNPLLVYVETSASSVSELVTEFFAYVSAKLDINSAEATIMYLGILIDSNRFKARTGTRTFEAAAVLRRLGVEPNEAENLLKEEYQEFEAKTAIMKDARLVFENMIVAATEKQVTRTQMSQVADYFLTIRHIEASFVIAYVAPQTVAVSARSKGVVNVQLIMEALGGGGHFTGAACMKENTTVEAVVQELEQVLNQMNEKENEDASNIIE